MTNSDRIDIYKDLSDNMKSNLDLHLKKTIKLFEILVCNQKIDDFDKLSEQYKYSECEITHMLSAILNSKIKNIDEKKEKILILEGHHKRLHLLQESLLREYYEIGSVDKRTYEDFASIEFEFIQKLTALVFESENYEKNFDGLTNIFNRKYFFEKIDHDVLKARRTKADFSIVMADIDYFKSINDTYGHQAGDYVLMRISKLFSEHIRVYDIVARYGGEEFIFFVYADAKEAFTLFARINEILYSQAIVINDEKIKITCSFGVAQDRDELSINELVTLADKALYKAKHSGRNKIVVF